MRKLSTKMRATVLMTKMMALLLLFLSLPSFLSSLRMTINYTFPQKKLLQRKMN